MNKISNFVEGIRLETSHFEGSPVLKKSSTRSRDDHIEEVAAAVDEESELNRVNMRTNELLLQAERFKAKVATPPKGIMNEIIPVQNRFQNPFDTKDIRDKFVTPNGLVPLNDEIHWIRNFDQDDEFFHVTCHVDDLTKNKIERGEFIDLEKLLPKEKNGASIGGGFSREDGIFKFGMKEGQAFVAPVSESVGRISSVKKWDQAFRVYAAIYSQANPSRAGEIWQYVFVIHNAASTFPWENVAYYDYTFRQLMASKPLRNWGKTYTQGWNIALKSSNQVQPARFGGAQNRAGPFSQTKQDWRDNCCRRFNKNKCTKTSNECRYDHRCTYCGGWQHSKANCRKKGTKEGNQRGKTSGDKVTGGDNAE